MGSVGVYIQRGVESLRSMLARKPQLRAELLVSLTEGALVRMIIPMVSLLHCAEWFTRFMGDIRYSLPVARDPDDTLSLHDESLRGCLKKQLCEFVRSCGRRSRECA